MAESRKLPKQKVAEFLKLQAELAILKTMNEPMGIYSCRLSHIVVVQNNASTAFEFPKQFGAEPQVNIRQQVKCHYGCIAQIGLKQILLYKLHAIGYSCLLGVFSTHKAPTKDIAPPNNQVSSATSALPELAATRAGVSKMPAPMTMPTIRATASINPNAGLGVAALLATKAFGF